MVIARAEYTISTLFDGENFYRAYADSADGSLRFNEEDSNRLYLGTYVGRTKPTDYSQYQWTLVKGRSITSVDVWYYLSTSSTSLDEGSWSTDAPTWDDGKFMWSKTITTYSTGDPTESTPVCITGSKGATGGTGRGVSSIVEEFYLSTSKTTQAGGSWSTTMPTWEQGKYVWTRSKITYTSGSPATDTTTPLVSSEWEAANLVESSLKSYIQSRGENLVTNGTGLLGNNTNFSTFEFDSSDAYFAKGSFKTSTYNSSKPIDELIPVNPELSYRMTYFVKANPSVGAKTYGMIVPYDMDGNKIGAVNHMYKANTLTTLSQDLKPGDTKIFLTDVSNWDNSGTAGQNTHLRSLIAWNWVSASGYSYPELTYSRNVWLGIWDPGSINTTENSITLKAPWSRVTLTAGTKVSNGSSGGTYKYIAGSGFTTPAVWTKYTGVISGVDTTGKNVTTNFSPGTAFVKVGWLVNYSINGGVSWFSNISFNVDFASQMQFDDILADNKLTPNEKHEVRREWDFIYTEFKGLSSQATSLGLIGEEATYKNAVAALGTYLNNGVNYSLSTTQPSWIRDDNIQVTTDITGVTFRNAFKTCYEAKMVLENAIAAKMKTLPDLAIENLSIGGRNFLRNSKALPLISSNETTHLGRTVRAFSGAFAARYAEPAESYTENIKAGETYTYSFDAAVVGDKGSYLRLYSGTLFSYTNVQNWENVTEGKFTKVFVTKTATSDATVQRIHLTYNGTGELYVCNFKLEKGNKATDWTPAPEDLDNEITDLKTASTALQNLTNTAFLDGIIAVAEAQAISEHLNTLYQENNEFISQYNLLYNNSNLVGTPKTALASALTTYNSSYNNLINSINTAIEGDKTTPAQKADVDDKFSSYKTGLADLSVKLVEAQNAIAKSEAISEANAYAEDLKTEIDSNLSDVSQSVTTLSDDIYTNFKDGIIAESESLSIKSYINILNNDKINLDNRYDIVYNNINLEGNAKLELGGSKVAYDSAHLSLIEVINSSIEDGKVTEIERSEVNTTFESYKSALGTLSTSLENAVIAIETNLINNIQVGGRNLLLNSNEEVTLLLQGEKSWTITQLKPNRQYTVSINGEGDNAPANVLLESYTDPVGVLQNNKLTFVAPGSSNSLKLISTGDLTFSKIKLESGHVATDWTAAPEDLESKVAELRTTSATKAEVLTTSDRIYSYVTSVEETIVDNRKDLEKEIGDLNLEVNGGFDDEGQEVPAKVIKRVEYDSYTKTTKEWIESVVSRVDTTDTTISDYTSWKQDVDKFNLNVTDGGGSNLLRNSVGYKDTEFWIKTGSGTASASTNLSGVSMHGWKLEGVVSLSQALDLKSSQKYCIRAIVQSPSGTFTRSIKLTRLESNTLVTEVVFSRSGEISTGEVLYNFDTTGWVNWSDANLVISQEGTSDEGSFQITDLGVYEGHNFKSWQQSSGEVYTLNVQIDVEGITVYSPNRISKTVMSPYEFAGYYDKKKIFTLNEDVTEVKSLEIYPEGSLLMTPVKFIQNQDRLIAVWVGE